MVAVLVLRVPGTPAPRERPDGAEEPRQLPRRPLRRLLTSYAFNTRRPARATGGDRILPGLTTTAFTSVAAVGIDRCVLIRFSEDGFHGLPGFYGSPAAAMALGGVVGGILAGRLGRFGGGLVHIAGNALEAVVCDRGILGSVAGAPVLMCLAGVLESGRHRGPAPIARHWTWRAVVRTRWAGMPRSMPRAAAAPRARGRAIPKDLLSYVPSRRS